MFCNLFYFLNSSTTLINYTVTIVQEHLLFQNLQLLLLCTNNRLWPSSSRSSIKQTRKSERSREFFGNKIDSIRTFDVVNQCSIEYLNEVSVLANIQDKSDINSRQSILSFTNKDCIFLFENIDSTIESFEKANQKLFEKNCSLENNLNNIFTDTRKFKLELKKFTEKI